MLWNSIKALRKENADLKAKFDAAEMRIKTEMECSKLLAEENAMLKRSRQQLEDARNRGFYLNLEPFCSHCLDFEADVEKIDGSTLENRNYGIVNISCERRNICKNIQKRMQMEMANGSPKEVEDEKREQKV